MPGALADGILKRWADGKAIFKKPWHKQYGEWPSSTHVSDQDVDALIGDVWSSETIDSWQQLYLLALLRKWRRQRGREDEQVLRERSICGSEIIGRISSSESSSEDDV